MSGLTFKPELLRKVLDGTKTQTRRPVKLERGPEGNWGAVKPCHVHEGQVVAVQPGRGKKARGRVEILTIRREPLQALTLRDANAEGFRTRDAFYAYWAELYRPDVFVERFILNGHYCILPAPEVWVITFKVGDGERHLGARPRYDVNGVQPDAPVSENGRGLKLRRVVIQDPTGETLDSADEHNRGYSRGEDKLDAGPAVDDEILKSQLEHAHKTWRERNRAEIERREAYARIGRLRAAEERALAQDIDVANERRRIEAAIADMQRKAGVAA